MRVGQHIPNFYSGNDLFSPLTTPKSTIQSLYTYLKDNKVILNAEKSSCWVRYWCRRSKRMVRLTITILLRNIVLNSPGSIPKTVLRPIQRMSRVVYLAQLLELTVSWSFGISSILRQPGSVLLIRLRRFRSSWQRWEMLAMRCELDHFLMLISSWVKKTVWKWLVVDVHCNRNWFE